MALTETLKAIGDAIRTKSGTTAKYKLKEMPKAILDIPQDGSATPQQPVTNFTMDIPHVVDGHWVCPDDWDNVIDMNMAGQQVIYLVYKTDDPIPFCRVQVPQAYTITWGHVVNNQFVQISAPEAQIANAYYELYPIESDFAVSGKNTKVLRISPATENMQITRVNLSSMAINNANVNEYFQPIVERRGRLPYMTALPAASYQLEACHLEGLKNLSGSIANAYANREYLKFHRHIGWSFAKVTNLSGFMQNTNQLVDVDMDWSDCPCSDMCTNMNYIFSSVRSYIGDINITNWDTTGVTSATGAFNNCYNLKHIIGLNDLKLPKTTSIQNLLSADYTLDMDVDFSNMQLNSLTGNAISGAFNSCYKLKSINISNANLSKITSVGSLFATCRSVSKIVMKGIIPPDGGLLTTATSMFADCHALQSIEYDGSGIFHNWNLSKCTNFYRIYTGNYQLRNINLGVPKVTNATVTTSNSVITEMTGYCYNATSIDLSAIDLRQFTYASGQISNTIYNCRELKDFYPPQNISFPINISGCDKLTHDSLLRIIDNLLPPTGSTAALTKLTFGTKNLVKLTEEEKTMITDKGWTLA